MIKIEMGTSKLKRFKILFGIATIVRKEKVRKRMKFSFKMLLKN